MSSIPWKPLKVWEDKLGMKAEIYPSWKSLYSKEDLYETVANIATLSYGNEEAKKPEALYKRLKTLKHNSIYEFAIDIRRKEFLEKTQIDNSGSMRIASSNRFISDETITTLENLPIKEEKKEEYLEKYKNDIFTFKITCPIVIARQFFRHRSLSYLELSRRYTKNNKVPFTPYIPSKISGKIKDKLMEKFNEAVNMYDELLKIGYNPEDARYVIPMSALTTFYVQGDYNEWKAFFELRTKKDAQYTFAELANSMSDLIEYVRENSYEYLEKGLLDV